MKTKLAEFLMVDESDLNLKSIGWIFLLTILLSPIGYFIVFAPPFWWIK